MTVTRIRGIDPLLACLMVGARYIRRLDYYATMPRVVRQGRSMIPPMLTVAAATLTLCILADR